MSLRTLFSRKSKVAALPVAPRNPCRYFKFGGGWGDRIGFSERPDERGIPNPCRMTGWKTPKPVPGDIILMPMESGRELVWLVQTVEHTTGVYDMFFAGTFCLGDKTEVEMPEQMPQGSWLL